MNLLRLLSITLPLLLMTSAVFADDDNETLPQTAPTQTNAGLSNPGVAPAAAGQAASGPGTAEKPSQAEGEKAPATSRPTAVPEFSLPEVVITGENELTIGANRLERKENDVTLGTQDLTGVDRSFNDLPGLSKTITALSTEEEGPSKDTALILHAGGGIPSTYGGWGLFGQEFKELEYFVTGYYSTWGGEKTGDGFDGDKKYDFGAETKIFPSAPLNFVLSGNYSNVEAELPYQNSIQELHQGLNLSGTANWKFSDLLLGQAKVTNQTTTLNYWDSSDKNNQTEELEGNAKVWAEEIDPFFNGFTLEAGGRHATSDFTGPSVNAYDWGWLGLEADFKHGENLTLKTKLQAQGGSGLNLPAALYPSVELLWRLFDKSEINLYWRTDRYVDSFYHTFLDTEHVSPLFGFPSATEVTGEWGGRFTQKVNEKIVFSLSASTAKIDNYHQWSDASALTPDYIQDYSTLSQVQINKAGANIQYNFMQNWQVAATYQWTQGINNSGNNFNFTELPMNKGVLSLYRGDDKLETRLDLQVVSERQAFEALSVTLPAYASVNFDATYHLTKTLSLWLNGDNLLGQSFEIQPGYLEPQVHLRGGVEVIF